MLVSPGWSRAKGSGGAVAYSRRPLVCRSHAPRPRQTQSYDAAGSRRMAQNEWIMSRPEVNNLPLYPHGDEMLKVYTAASEATFFISQTQNVGALVEEGSIIVGLGAFFSFLAS